MDTIPNTMPEQPTQGNRGYTPLLKTPPPINNYPTAYRCISNSQYVVSRVMEFCVFGVVLIFAVVFLLLFPGCSHRVVKVVPDVPVDSEKEVVQILPDEIEALLSADKQPVRVSFPAVYFDYDRSDIRWDARDVLFGILRGLNEGGVKRVVVEGYCDERGSVGYNEGLGLKRARSVVSWFEAAGLMIDYDVLSYGKSRLKYEGCEMEDCHQENRRVEVRVE